MRWACLHGSRCAALRRVSRQSDRATYSGLLLGLNEIADLCRAHGVARLRLFGSATKSEFDPVRSDFVFFVDFENGHADLFSAYFDFKEALEPLLGRPVDLVVSDAVANPHFAKTALAGARDLYAA